MVDPKELNGLLQRLLKRSIPNYIPASLPNGIAVYGGYEQNRTCRVIQLVLYFSVGTVIVCIIFGICDHVVTKQFSPETDYKYIAGPIMLTFHIIS